MGWKSAGTCSAGALRVLWAQTEDSPTRRSPRESAIDAIPAPASRTRPLSIGPHPCDDFPTLQAWLKAGPIVPAPGTFQRDGCWGPPAEPTDVSPSPHHPFAAWSVGRSERPPPPGCLVMESLLPGLRDRGRDGGSGGMESVGTWRVSSQTRRARGERS